MHKTNTENQSMFQAHRPGWVYEIEISPSVFPAQPGCNKEAQNFQDLLILCLCFFGCFSNSFYNYCYYSCCCCWWHFCALTLWSEGPARGRWWQPHDPEVMWSAVNEQKSGEITLGMLGSQWISPNEGVERAECQKERERKEIEREQKEERKRLEKKRKK